MITLDMVLELVDEYCEMKGIKFGPDTRREEKNAYHYAMLKLKINEEDLDEITFEGMILID